MKILDISIKNFRRYDQATFRFHPKFTVLIGDNAKGKTTVLDAIALMLGTYFQGSGIQTGQSVVSKRNARLVSHEKGGQLFLEQQKDVYLTARAIIHDSKIEWRRDMSDRGKKARDLIEIGNKDRERIRKGEDCELPLLLYYGSGRLWDIHRDVQIERPKSQLDAYRYCLDPKSDQKAFEKWFKKLSLSELQKGKIIPAIQAIVDSVKTCIPDTESFYYDAVEDQVMIKLLNEGLTPFNNLSDGYRNMVAMVADIAHRAARLNPHFENYSAKQTKGVVLIDEIDLHLHPKWQRSVVRDLQAAFPEIQFIASTHSPFIIQSLEPGEVIDLNRPTENIEMDVSSDFYATPGPLDSYSNRSIEDIVEEIMGVAVPQRSQRYQKMFEVAKEYYTLLQKGPNADPMEKKRLKEKLDGLSAPFSDNIAYHAFLEMERLAAGI